MQAGLKPNHTPGFSAGGTTAVSSLDSNGPDSAGPSKWPGACSGVIYSRLNLRFASVLSIQQ